MQLRKLTDKVYYLPTVPGRDWPVLTYVRGERFALAVDAGYSKQQVESFYSELDAAGLKRPDFTALTHWHYDHCFGLHAIDGLAIACEDTNAILRALSLKSGTQELLDEMLALDPGIANEYPDAPSLTVVPAGLELRGELRIDLGGVTAQLFETESPHTKDTMCVYIPEERVLVLGDATGGDYFNNGYMDKAKLLSLTETIESLDCAVCVLGHEEPMERDALLSALRDMLKA